jgi:hypothetical protein
MKFELVGWLQLTGGRREPAVRRGPASTGRPAGRADAGCRTCLEQAKKRDETYIYTTVVAVVVAVVVVVVNIYDILCGDDVPRHLL